MNAHRASGAPRPESPARATAILVAVALTAGTVHAQNPQSIQPVALNADTPAANAGASSQDLGSPPRRHPAALAEGDRGYDSADHLLRNRLARRDPDRRHERQR